jgi:hypothetical protein
MIPVVLALRDHLSVIGDVQITQIMAEPPFAQVVPSLDSPNM